MTDDQDLRDRTYDKDEREEKLTCTCEHNEACDVCTGRGASAENCYYADDLDEMGRVVFIGPVSPTCDVKLFSSRSITNVEVTRLIVLLSTMIQNEVFDPGSVTQPTPLKDLSDEDLGAGSSLGLRSVSQPTPLKDLSDEDLGVPYSPPPKGDEPGPTYSEFVKARKERERKRPK